MGMLYTIYMLGALAAAVPIALHLLRRKPDKVQPFPSFMFFDRSTIPTNRRNNLRKLLLLMLRCLVFCLLAMAFAWPYLPKYQQVEQSTVVLWDGSFSMDARPYRAHLQSEAVSLLETAGKRTPIALGVVGDRVDFGGDFSTERSALMDRFDSRPTAMGTSRFERAIRQADLKLASAPGQAKRIVLITDRQLVPWQDVSMNKPLSPGTKLEIVSPESGGFENAAISEASIDAPFTSPKQRLILRVRARNFMAKDIKAASCSLEIEVDGKKVAGMPMAIDAMGEAQIEVPLPPMTLQPHAGRAALVIDDDVQVDNVCHFAINPSAMPKVAVAPAPKSSLEYIRFTLSPYRSRSQIELVELSSQSSESEYLKSDVIIVSDAPRPGGPVAAALSRRLVEGARVICIWQDSPAMRQWLRSLNVKVQEVASDDHPRRLAAVDFEHPVFSPFLRVKVGGLFGVLFFNPPRLALPRQARVIAQYNDGAPAMAEMEVGDGKLLILASSMTRQGTDWPVHASFLPFWRYVLGYASRGNIQASSFPVSNRALKIDVAAAKDMASGEDVPLNRGQFVPLKAGNYLLTGKNGRSRAISVNAPPGESDPLALTQKFSTDQLVSREPQSGAAPTASLKPEDEGRSFWWMILALTGCLLLGELLLANRTAL